KADQRTGRQVHGTGRHSPGDWPKRRRLVYGDCGLVRPFLRRRGRVAGPRASSRIGPRLPDGGMRTHVRFPPSNEARLAALQSDVERGASPPTTSQAKPSGGLGRFDLRQDGGANRDRTGDLLLAKQALSQLSYGPASSNIRTTERISVLAARRDDAVRGSWDSSTAPFPPLTAYLGDRWKFGEWRARITRKLLGRGVVDYLSKSKSRGGRCSNHKRSCSGASRRKSGVSSRTSSAGSSSSRCALTPP